MIKIKPVEKDLPEMFVRKREIALIRKLIAWECKVPSKKVVIESMVVVDYDYQYCNTFYDVQVVTNLGTFIAYYQDTINGPEWDVVLKKKELL